MTGIAGINHPEAHEEVNLMLDEIAHRGKAGRAILEFDNATFGVVWTNSKESPIPDVTKFHAVQDCAGEGQFARAQTTGDGLSLTRDQVGVAPLYYGHTRGGEKLCFASEVKALLKVSGEVQELLPGHHLDGSCLQSYFQLEEQPSLRGSPEDIAGELRKRLTAAVRKRIDGEKVMGVWLSGGLDSSTLAAIARPYLEELHTFAIGLSDAPDLESARRLADFIGAEHHEIVVDVEDLLKVLPEVVFHLESFDALLVRSTLTNYLVAEAASRHVFAVLSGEGGDELFAGYAYLKAMKSSELPKELVDITGRLHNTALQRVDRSASAHGTVAHVAFLDPDVLDFALRIPSELKVHGGIEKWILRKAMHDALPKQILNRTKSKFWEGSGLGEQLLHYAEEQVDDAEFRRERRLANGWELNSKEELMYYRLFRDHLGRLKDLSWMGRTKGAPRSQFS